MTFAEKLKLLRGKSGLTQTQLAEASGLSLGTIHDYEQGKKEPTLRSAVKLARALGVAVQEFVDSVEDESEESGSPPPAPRGRPRKAPADEPAPAAEPPAEPPHPTTGPSPAEPKAEQPAGEAKPKKPRKSKGK